jgi:ketosteroid isomerase-like protein
MPARQSIGGHFQLGWGNMRLFITYAIIATAVASCVRSKMPPASAEQRQIERATLAITDSVAAAVGRRDVPRLAGLLADAQYIGSGLLIPPGRFAEMAGPAFQQIAAITLTWQQREVRMLAPDAALMTARGTNVARDLSGKMVREDGLYTMVFASDSSGVWRLVSLHKTTVSASPRP